MTFFIDKEHNTTFLERTVVIQMIDQLIDKETKQLHILDLSIIDNDVTLALIIVNRLKSMGIDVILKNRYEIAAYIRVSTDKQKNEGVSLDSQQIEIFKRLKNMDIVTEMKDIKFYIDDGYSAKSFNRPKVQEIIKKMKDGKIALIGIYDLSRLSRDVSDSNWIIQIAKTTRTVMISVYDDVKYETASDRFSLNIKSCQNMYERERTVERTNDGLKYIAQTLRRFPLGGTVRFGYYRNKDKNIEINKEEADLFVKAVEMANQRYYIQDIVNYLNSQQKKKIFNAALVKSMFNDDKYAGIFEYKGEVYYDIIPPIVSYEQLQNARRLFKKSKKKDVSHYYFDGIIFCKCGRKMSCTHGNSKGKKYYYYLCSDCHSTISQKKLEKDILYMEMLKSNKNEANRIKNDFYQVERKIAELKEKYFHEAISLEDFCLCAKALEDKKADIEKKMQLSKSPKGKEKYADMTTSEEKKAFVNRYFKQIIINPLNKTIEDIILY